MLAGELLQRFHQRCHRLGITGRAVLERRVEDAGTRGKAAVARVVRSHRRAADVAQQDRLAPSLRERSEGCVGHEAFFVLVDVQVEEVRELARQLVEDLHRQCGGDLDDALIGIRVVPCARHDGVQRADFRVEIRECGDAGLRLVDPLAEVRTW